MANEVRIKINADTSDAESAANRVGNAFGNMNDKLKSIRLPLAAAGAAVSGLGVASVKLASDATESINAVNVVFGEASNDILEFGKIASTAIGLSASEFNQLSTSAGTLLKATGQPMTEVAKNTIDLSKRAADLASVFNTDVESAMSAINQALRGESEAIRRFGSDVTDAALETFLLSQGIDASVSEMTNQEKTLIRLQKIMADTQQVQGDFANTSDSLANRQRIMSSQIKDVGAQFGTVLLPAAAAAANALEKVVNIFAELPGPMRTAIVVVGAAVAGLAVLGLAIPPIVAGIGAVSAAMGILNLAMGPVGLAILGISAAIAAGILIWRNWDTIVATFADVFNQVKAVFENVTEALEFAYRSRLGWLLPGGPLVKGIFQLRDNWSTIWETIVEIFDTVSNAILAVYNSNFVWLLPGGALIKGLHFVLENWTAIWTTISNFTSTIWETIKGIVKTGADFVSGLIQGVIDKVKAALALLAQIPGVGAAIDATTTVATGVAQDFRTTRSLLLGEETPGFANGGVVPGPRGSPQLILAHGGETYLPTHRPGGAAMAGVVINNDFAGATIIGIDDLEETIAASVEAALTRQTAGRSRR